MGVKYRCEIKQHGWFLTKEEELACPNHTCHRIWFKVLLNPLLRKFGFHIVSHVDDTTNLVVGYSLRRYRKGDWE